MRPIRGTINSVQVLGWLGNDPEVRMLGNGATMCRFNVATKHFGGQDESGNRVVETHWVAVEAWEKLAELCNTYTHKGSRVLVEGSLRTDTWADKESGQPRSRTYVRAANVLFLDSRPEQAAAEMSEDAVEEIPF
ncbi:single-stranded DNA-binding protein [Candidatus Gracilibacteria bacterium]|nr:single-stranded DNA-binding protein [Candidatus Gracilibacteria bacterium]